MQLAYRRLVALLRCPFVLKIMYRGIPSPVKLESCHISLNVRGSEKKIDK
jgi:hypothetical protein